MCVGELLVVWVWEGRCWTEPKNGNNNGGEQESLDFPTENWWPPDIFSEIFWGVVVGLQGQNTVFFEKKNHERKGTELDSVSKKDLPN